MLRAPLCRPLPGGRPSPLPRLQHLKTSGSWAQDPGPILIAHLWSGQALIGGPLPRDPRGSPHVPSHRPGAAPSKSQEETDATSTRERPELPGQQCRRLLPRGRAPADPEAGGGHRGRSGRTWRREPRAPGSTASGPCAVCAGSAAGRQAAPLPARSLARWLSWAPCPGRYLIKQRTGRQAGAQAEVPGRARQEEVCPTAGRGAVQSCH